MTLNIALTFVVTVALLFVAHSTIALNPCSDPITLTAISETYRTGVIDSLFNISLGSAPFTNECIDYNGTATHLNTHAPRYCRSQWGTVGSLIEGCTNATTGMICYDQIPGPACDCFGTKEQISCLMTAISNWRRNSTA